MRNLIFIDEIPLRTSFGMTSKLLKEFHSLFKTMDFKSIVVYFFKKGCGFLSSSNYWNSNVGS